MLRHPGATEGDLAWMRQSVVSRAACAEVATESRLPEAMVAAAPEGSRQAARRLSQQESVRAALVESVIGAAYEELGSRDTGTAILGSFGAVLDAAVPGRRDPKTALQEEAARREMPLRYELASEEGPPHKKTFVTHAVLGGCTLGEGRGRSKQASESAAAEMALLALERDE